MDPAPALARRRAVHEMLKAALYAVLTVAAASLLGTVIWLLIEVRSDLDAQRERDAQVSELLERQKLSDTAQAAELARQIDILTRRQQGQIDAHDDQVRDLMQQTLDAILRELNDPANREQAATVVIRRRPPVPQPTPAPSPSPACRRLPNGKCRR